jgi:hypothetical protein
MNQHVLNLFIYVLLQVVVLGRSFDPPLDDDLIRRLVKAASVPRTPAAPFSTLHSTRGNHFDGILQLLSAISCHIWIKTLKVSGFLKETTSRQDRSIRHLNPFHVEELR